MTPFEKGQIQVSIELIHNIPDGPIDWNLHQ